MNYQEMINNLKQELEKCEEKQETLDPECYSRLVYNRRIRMLKTAIRALQELKDIPFNPKT